MTDLKQSLDAFGERLERASLSTPSARPRRLSRRTSLIGTLGALAIAAPTLAATQPWGPLLGDEQRGQPTRALDQPPAEQLAGLAVLRRSQTQSDRGPAAVKALGLQNPDVSGVRTQYVRVLTADAATAVLIPVGRFNLRGLDHLPAPPPDASPRVRALFQAMRERLRPQSDGLCLFVPDPVDGGGQSCSSWSDVKSVDFPSSLGDVLYGLVPDGVTDVAIGLIDGQQIAAPVHENFYAIDTPDKPGCPTASPPKVASVQWKAQDGAVLQRRQRTGHLRDCT